MRNWMIGTCALLSACGEPPAPPSSVTLDVDPVPGEALDVSSLSLLYGPPPDPIRSDGGRYTQALALFGREDLFDAIPNPGQEPPCDPLDPATGRDALSDILARVDADDAQIVIVNESHSRARHRVLTRDLIAPLRTRGFTYFAAETFNWSVSDREATSYLLDSEGYYAKESVFGQTARAALAQGYTLVPYEWTVEQSQAAPRGDRIANVTAREEAQATNLVAGVFDQNPAAKILIHVGYGHGAEVSVDWGTDQVLMMAGRLKEKTGIDPLTINQTACAPSGEGSRLVAPSPWREPGEFDLYVAHAPQTFTKGRPDWRRTDGAVDVEIPAALWPTDGWSIIEARPLNEPDGAVPVDRVAVSSTEEVGGVVLVLPPGDYRVRAVPIPSP